MILFLSFASWMTAEDNVVSSPDGQLKAIVKCEGGKLKYEVVYKDKQIVRSSSLGLSTNLTDLTRHLSVVKTETGKVEKKDKMSRTKQSFIDYHANTLTVTCQNADSMQMQVVFQVSDNNVAFRYLIPKQRLSKWRESFSGTGAYKRLIVKEEASAFRFPATTTTFICPQTGPDTGWENTKPSYEEEYLPDAPVNSVSKYGKGYTFPCLFHVDDCWALVSETGVGGNYCGSHLSDYSPDKGYRIAFPDAGENGGFGSPYAALSLPAATPWRTITVGETLKPIVETTIAYDLVDPLYEPSADYRPGRYTWSWLIWQDNSINYDDQVQFIDLAAAMGYEYCLVDNYWDDRIGRDRIADLSKYAQSKGVSLMLWYNSNGIANDAPQSPRNCMNTAVAREKEMRWLRQVGVKGIKVDFFGGDKQETMRLYEDILSDANRYGLQVIFHGCTLPRGWERMYPNYVASEAVLASENVYFTAYHADREGYELTLHPFIRNTVASMDWGGVIMNRYLSKDNRKRHPRKTSDVFEMATGITNQSSVNCVAIQPNNLSELPAFELEFLRQLPTTWEETRFIDGYPGKFIIMARRHGDNWYVAGLNGTDEPLSVNMDLSAFFTPQTLCRLYIDNPKTKEELVPSSIYKEVRLDKKACLKVTLQPMGGIILQRRTSTD